MKQQIPYQLPATLNEAHALGWAELDVILVTGDAHVDHASFPAALLGRVLIDAGFRVGIIARPDVSTSSSVTALGTPNLFFGVTAGALDSMVANYTALKKRRSDDPYSPGGVAGGRPDRAVTVYCNLIRQAFGKSAFIVAGGLEASLRKFAHYDFWSDSIRRPLLMDCGADVLVHGMGEGPVVEIGKRLRGLLEQNPALVERRKRGETVDPAMQLHALRDVPGLVYREAASLPIPHGDGRGDVFFLPSVEDVQGSGPAYARAFAEEWSWATGAGGRAVAVAGTGAGGRAVAVAEEDVDKGVDKARGADADRDMEAETEAGTGSGACVDAAPNTVRCLCQNCGGMRVVANRPWSTPSASELDRYYGLPFTRNVHPIHGTGTQAQVPALQQVRFSVTSHRGCAGGCSFCAICAHQGRGIISRSHQSIIAEVEEMVSHPQFKGIINDIGGPSANMYGLGCTRQQRECNRVSCLWPSPCRHFRTDSSQYEDILEHVRLMTGVRRVFITTGIRMDLAILSPGFIKALARYHTCGHLKVAPEHLTSDVLRLMHKPKEGVFRSFLQKYIEQSEQAGKKQYVLPYFMAAHPGSTMQHMVEIALFMKRENLRVEQCQIFTPTPGTAATVMYATGIDPFTMQPVFVERDPRRKELQKALILAHLPENRDLVKEALHMCGRDDLVGFLLAGGAQRGAIPKTVGKRSRGQERSRSGAGSRSDTCARDGARAADARNRRKSSSRGNGSRQ